MDIFAIRGKIVSAVIFNYNAVNLEKKLTIECRDQFSIFVFGRRIDQSITL